MVFSLSAGKGHTLDGQVIRLGAAARKDNPPCRTVNQLCNASSRCLHRTLCCFPLSIDARGIAKGVMHVLDHRCLHFPGHGCCGIVIEIDAVVLRPFFLLCHDMGETVFS